MAVTGQHIPNLWGSHNMWGISLLDKPPFAYKEGLWSIKGPANTYTVRTDMYVGEKLEPFFLRN
jgi:hypothetical protein